MRRCCLSCSFYQCIRFSWSPCIVFVLYHPCFVVSATRLKNLWLDDDMVGVKRHATWKYLYICENSVRFRTDGLGGTEKSIFYKSFCIHRNSKANITNLWTMVGIAYKIQQWLNEYFCTYVGIDYTYLSSASWSEEVSKDQSWKICMADGTTFKVLVGTSMISSTFELVGRYFWRILLRFYQSTVMFLCVAAGTESSTWWFKSKNLIWGYEWMQLLITSLHNHLNTIIYLQHHDKDQSFPH